MPEWDSMCALSIISLLDRVTEAEMENDDADRLTSFQAIVDYVRSHGRLDG
jgi:acyl carrier protein